MRCSYNSQHETCRDDAIVDGLDDFVDHPIGNRLALCSVHALMLIVELSQELIFKGQKL